MAFNSEFEKYAVKHRGISSNTLHSYASHLVTGMTPNIIEERSLNVAVMVRESPAFTMPSASLYVMAAVGAVLSKVMLVEDTAVAALPARSLAFHAKVYTAPLTRDWETLQPFVVSVMLMVCAPDVFAVPTRVQVCGEEPSVDPLVRVMVMDPLWMASERV